ncbi:MAG: protein kinase, partial [Planctomycetota bacterium]
MRNDATVLASTADDPAAASSPRGEASDPASPDSTLSEPRSAPVPGLPPRYRAAERVGRGGLGEVWRVQDENLSRPLAIKALRPDRREDADAAARLIREAELTGALQHPGVPPVHERGELADGSPFFSMKLIAGRTLREVLDEAKPTDRSGLLDVFRDICQTLA